MRCPKCSHLMLKANLAEGGWECSVCKRRWFIILTTDSKSDRENLVEELLNVINSDPTLQLRFNERWFRES